MEQELYNDVKQFINEHKARVVTRPILISEAPNWLCDSAEQPWDRQPKYKRAHSEVETLVKNLEEYTQELRAKLAAREAEGQKIEKVLRELEAYYVLHPKVEWTVEKRKDPEPTIAVPDTSAAQTAKKPAPVVARK